MKTLRSIALIAFALIAVFALSACGNSAEKLNNEGNEAYVQQAYEEALTSYQSAQIENPELVEPHYNAANTLYRAGDYAGALEELQMALALADAGDENQPLEIAQASFFNAGNSSYNTQELESAVDSYRQALLINSDDLDAKYNLELALQQQQEQQQEQQEQEQENQEENQDQEQSEDSEEQSEDQPQDGEQDNEQEQEQSENGENEEQNQDESDNQSEEGQNQDEPQEGNEQESDQQDGEPQDEQEGDQQPDEGEPQPAEEDPHGQESYAPAPGERMSEEQAKQLLAAIAGDSDTLMERLNQILTVNMQPPTQDW